MFSLFHNVTFLKIFSNSYVLQRYLRNASKRVTSLKTLKDFKVKNVEEEEDFSAEQYDDMVKRVRQNDLEIEDNFANEQGIDNIVSESYKLYGVNESEEKAHRCFVKKQIISRKYFQTEKETNLLTYAAKKQIRYLHNLDSSEWTPETLAKSFPISVAGVKRLLKSNYGISSPEKIKLHDDEVRKRWEILKSGKSSDSISFYTQYLWNEGKLFKENYNGNPNLPSMPSFTPPKVIENKRAPVGEFSSIVQKYVEYKAQMESTSSSQLKLSTKSDSSTEHIKSYSKDDNKTRNLMSKKSTFIIDEEGDYTPKSKDKSEIELSFSQFKENLVDDLKFQDQSSPSVEQYQNIVNQQPLKENNHSKHFNTAEHFSVISKYNKERIELNQDKSKLNNLYSYDNKLGYIHPRGKSVKGKIKVSAKSQMKNGQYKVGNCVYDEDGELLYKLPR